MPLSPRKAIALALIVGSFAACGDVHDVTSPRKSLAGKSHLAVEAVWRTEAAKARDVKRWKATIRRDNERRWYAYWRWVDTVRWVTASGVYWPGATGNVNGFVCGGPLPSCCTLRIESHGTPTAQNPSSSSSGLWQFTHDTWAGHGGFAEAKYAPPGTQNERASDVFAGGRGASNWYGDGCYPGG